MPEKPTETKTQQIMAERKENTARVTAALEAQGYHAENATVSIVKANVMACVTALPFSVLAVLAFVLLHPEVDVLDTLGRQALLLLVLMAVSVPVHEGLHGCGWVGFCREKWRSIQFGVMWESLTPYCHCREALTVVQYDVGLLLPFTVLGLIPSVIALFMGSPLLMALGAYNLFVAGGDTTIACIITKYLGKDARILDHPDQCGAVGFVR